MNVKQTNSPCSGALTDNHSGFGDLVGGANNIISLCDAAGFGVDDRAPYRLLEKRAKVLFTLRMGRFYPDCASNGVCGDRVGRSELLAASWFRLGSHPACD